MEQFPGGHSNLTYLLRGGDGGPEYVLRRAPLGPVAPKAHDMARECRFLEAVHPHFSQAPKPALVCEDPSILGAVFFVMERRRGVIFLESSRPGQVKPRGKITAAAATGPASGPRPASSMPAIHARPRA